MNITTIVILYNSRIIESETLQSITDCSLDNISLTINIWNNGPILLEENDIQNFFSTCASKNINVRIYQDTRNLALSKVYNFISKERNYNFISILDQDTSLPTRFFQNIHLHRDRDIIVPIIIAEKDGILVQNYPHVYGDDETLINEGKVKVRINSVMSGITLSARMIRKIVNFRKYAFEERLAFYGIDSDLFRTINLMLDSGIPIEIYCINNVHHSFAIFNPEEATSSFRNMEIFYFKFFIRQAYSKKSTLSTLWVCIRDFLRLKNNLEKTKNLIKFTLNGAHPRSKFEIVPDTRPTHES
ncbi:MULTISPECIES: hypothetical protein [Pectobacterium]|uniref:hypothetical protein n=1 Tax=Pectobacterium TaxID=122277 RepID=UPI000D725E60|nr:MULTISPECIES: hypothetical protein [Pectobacterium]MBA0218978.1 hypothetical protein [Pectobacterium brasiliense]MBN3073219.1 hypothetical protein [Pectobacterium brasiliense]MBN3168917.1 hypothetical protein [Pectobacterium brasiliense]PXB02227.1 hypothetical protein DMB41_09660 [Pectobacterium carotovorum subsp. carotovorum]